MNDEENLFKMIDNECGHTREYYFDLEQEQQRHCGEMRWIENNREINLRNYEARPEDYRN